MKITIHGQDYTSALDATQPLTVERRWNEPSVCAFLLCLPRDNSLAAPVRGQAAAITGDDGETYFTGYIAATPMPEYCGLAMEGPRYRLAVQAVSDEILLDQLPLLPGAGAVNETASARMMALVERSGATSVSAGSATLNTPVSYFAPQSGATWSRNAGQIAAAARATYRVVNGVLSLVAVGSTVHALSESDSSLDLSSLSLLSLTASAKRSLANDVTVYGEHEPVEYVTEFFTGDGVTTQFNLSETPFFLPSTRATLARELFEEGSISMQVWNALNSSGYLSIGAGGLTMRGGSGVDGATMLSWIDSVEMGGTLLLEATGVTLGANSNGILAGFFAGGNTAGSCIAGFQVMSTAGVVMVQPLVHGAVAGTAFAVSAANQYTLRMRVHCPEVIRAQAVYRSYGDTGAIVNGGANLAASGFVQMEIEPFVNGVGSAPVVLYDGAIQNLPAACSLVAVSSVTLFGSMRSIALSHLGSGWVTSTPQNGSAYTRRMGNTAAAGECAIERAGRLVFYAGEQPAVGEQVMVRYRTIGRAVGRAVNATNQQALTALGVPAIAAWTGTVERPAARCSADCRNAALSLAQTAASVSALWSGSYKCSGTELAADVWPGDALALTANSAGVNTQMIVRRVRMQYVSSVPERVEYEIAFANDWAEDLAIATSATVPADAWLPVAVAPVVLTNTAALVVTALSNVSLSMDAGIDPPSGGGFEVRRRDFAFMPGEDPDLALRSTTRNFTLTRQSASDRFYIRMYDGATPPNYSEFSAVVIVNPA